jgi:hypothetical protein
MADWPTIASLATAGGTLVLAVATFSSVRAGRRSTRIAERSTGIAERALLIGMRPVPRARYDPATKAYIARKEAEGKTKKGSQPFYGFVEMQPGPSSDEFFFRYDYVPAQTGCRAPRRDRDQPRPCGS